MYIVVNQVTFEFDNLTFIVIFCSHISILFLFCTSRYVEKHSFF